MTFLLSFIQVTTYNVDLWERMVSYDIDISHCLKTFIQRSSVLLYILYFCIRVIMEPTLLCFIDCPSLIIPLSILSSFVYFEFSLRMMLCGIRFGYLQRVAFMRKVLEFQSHFQMQKPF